MKVSFWSISTCTVVKSVQGIPITSPSFWHDEEESTEEVYRKVFRSATEESIPLFDKRVVILQEAAEVLCKVHESAHSPSAEHHHD